MSIIFLEPPHVSIAIYSALPEVEVFARLCHVALDLGCVASGRVEVAPRDLEFELLSDLGSEKTPMNARGRSWENLVDGSRSDIRVVRALFEHPKLKSVLVEYQQRTGPGRHPITISCNAGPLGIPDFLWARRDRKSAYALGDLLRVAFESATKDASCEYGMMGVEFTMPTPSQLGDPDTRIVSEVFVAARLLGRDEQTRGKLVAVYSEGDVRTMGHGDFYSGWAPFNEPRKSVPEPEQTAEQVRKCLDRIISKHAL